MNAMMKLAFVAAERATCSRLAVGAVLSRGPILLAEGYNGAPVGHPHCVHDGTEEHCEIAVHAEVNAVLMAARLGIPTVGATLWATHVPCPRCAGLIVNAGIVRVVYHSFYKDDRGLGILWVGGVDSDWDNS